MADQNPTTIGKNFVTYVIKIPKLFIIVGEVIFWQSSPKEDKTRLKRPIQKLQQKHRNLQFPWKEYMSECNIGNGPCAESQWI